MTDVTAFRPSEGLDLTPHPKQLYFIYDSALSFSGAFRFLRELIKGKTECALCEITHAGLMERKAWKECRANLDVGVKLFLRNQVSRRLAEAARDEYPTVVVELHDGALVKLIAKQELQDCGGSPEDLCQLLERALSRRIGWVR